MARASSAPHPAAMAQRWPTAGARRRVDDPRRTGQRLSRGVRPCLWRGGGPRVADAGFAERIRASDAFIHVSDTAGRDILEATSAADVIGGLAAAAKALGRDPALYSLDSSNPESAQGPHAGRGYRAHRPWPGSTHPRWIASQLAHGWRGAAELGGGGRYALRLRGQHGCGGGWAVRCRLSGLLRRCAGLVGARSRQCASGGLDPLTTGGGGAARSLDQPAQFGRRLPGAGGGGMSAFPESCRGPKGSAAARLVPEHAEADGDRRWPAGAAASARQRG